jgi:hypothetical protein
MRVYRSYLSLYRNCGTLSVRRVDVKELLLFIAGVLF